MTLSSIFETFRAFFISLKSRPEFSLSVIDFVRDGAKYPDPLIQAFILAFLATLVTWILSLIPMGAEFKRNYSHFDRLWSILPIPYALIYFCHQVYISYGLVSVWENLKSRTFICFILILIWGIRLTLNAKRRGYYSWSYEDYRWEIVKKLLTNPIMWELFNFLFITVFQSGLVFSLTWPVYYIFLLHKKLVFDPLILSNSSLNSTQNHNPLLLKSPTIPPLKLLDFVFFIVMSMLLVFETIADNQQFEFQQDKRKYYSALAKHKIDPKSFPNPDPNFSKERISEIKAGFRFTGLWRYSRHPNFFCEQSFWIVMALYGYLNGLHVTELSPNDFRFIQYSIGAITLALLFDGSVTLTEAISESKYPLYVQYQKETNMLLPWFSKPHFQEVNNKQS
ncbi:hypothetical protein BB560_003351 [Smittium megazygosporum]|uniref:Steroid 5-alpha reductase C-terminal domain-containing protein n=1 Tax=Smittium megazygosporum TaxID=133381 RepID=A0A2T9ZC85_9FUNG|nr:hypothetical protein BB560_003351 [Smittium megazygosporum]